MSETKKKQYASKEVKIWNDGLTKETDNSLLLISEKLSAANKGKNTGSKNPMFGKDVADFMTPEANAARLKKISEFHKNKPKSKEQKEKLSKYSKKRFWIVNKNGKLSHCLDLNDVRLLSGEWQIGRIWKM